MSGKSLQYAGFWLRFGAMLVDVLVLLPLAYPLVWCNKHYRLSAVYTLVVWVLFDLFYEVYLVRRFGGTPGKRFVGIQIRKLNGEPVGYREAFLRSFPNLLIYALSAGILLVPLVHMTDTEYFSFPLAERKRHVVQLAPWYYKPVDVAQSIWTWSELLVLLTNKKRRAVHDFIAGTIVVKDPANVPLAEPPVSPAEATAD